MKPKLLSYTLILLLLLTPLQNLFASEFELEILIPVVIFYNENYEIIDILPVTDETGTPYYLHPDHLNSTNVVSDNTGAKVELLDYFPYADQRISSGSSLIKDNT